MRDSVFSQPLAGPVIGLKTSGSTRVEHGRLGSFRDGLGTVEGRFPFAQLQGGFQPTDLPLPVKNHPNRRHNHVTTGRAGRWRFSTRCAKVRLGAKRCAFVTNQVRLIELFTCQRATVTQTMRTDRCGRNDPHL